MDFVTSLPVWVVVDSLTNTDHFLPIHLNYSMDKLAQLYIQEIVRLHGVSETIMSDRDPRFQSILWKSLFEAMDTKLQPRASAHP